MLGWSKQWTGNLVYMVDGLKLLNGPDTYWYCGSLQDYWLSIWQCKSKHFHIPLELSAKLSRLGATPVTWTVDRCQWEFECTIRWW